MNKVILYCRQGFEKECAAEITDKAAQLGVYGFARVKEQSGYVVFECYQPQEADKLGRELPFSSLIFARQMIVAGDNHLTGKNQRAERQFAPQLIRLLRLIAFKHHIPGLLFYAGEPVYAKLRRFVGYLRRALFFKTLAAVQNDLIHEPDLYASDAPRQLTSIPNRRGNSRRPPA